MYILFNVGGTKIRLAVSRSDKTVYERSIRIFHTPIRFKDGMNVFKKYRDTLGEKKIKKVVGGIPGVFNKEKSKLISSPNMHGWVGKPLGRELTKIFKAPVFLDNDTIMEGMGEASFGAGKGKKIVVYMTIGTGVGGAKIINGLPDENKLGFEPGHQIVVLGGDECSCGGLGHVESYVSGRALKKRYGKTGSLLDKKQVNEVMKILAAGLNNITVMWSPDVIILGGGLIDDGIFSLPKLRARVKKLVKVFDRMPPLRKSALGEKNGLYGALAYANKCCR